jgi:hypothetical protein
MHWRIIFCRGIIRGKGATISPYGSYRSYGSYMTHMTDMRAVFLMLACPSESWDREASGYEKKLVVKNHPM